MAAEQVLHVVLRGREQNVDPGLIHQPIEAMRIERNRGCNLLDDVEHDQSSLWADCSAPCAARAWMSARRSYTNPARPGHAPASARGVPATCRASPPRHDVSLVRFMRLDAGDLDRFPPHSDVACDHRRVRLRGIAERVNPEVA